MSGRPKHTRTGNCTAVAFSCPECGDAMLCDVCHKHDAPRGECKKCPPCLACIRKPPHPDTAPAAAPAEGSEEPERSPNVERTCPVCKRTIVTSSETPMLAHPWCVAPGPAPRGAP